MMAHHSAANRDITLSKFDHCPLSLPDQVYLIFRRLRSVSLSLKAIICGLQHHFDTPNVEQWDIERLRFLYILKQDGRYNITLKSDDICPKGFNCKKDHSSCGRIHSIIREHVCRHINFKTMWCEHRECRLMHLPRSKIRDRLLSVILFLYARICRENGNVPLKDLVITDNDLVGAYFEIYDDAPIPKMTRCQWKRLVHLYRKYHIDHHQQRRLLEMDKDRTPPFTSLWRTDFMATTRCDDKRWTVTMLRGYKFVIARICKSWTEPGSDCKWNPSFFCPFFHLDRKCVSFGSDCKHCHLQRPQVCRRWHFDNFDRRKVWNHGVTDFADFAVSFVLKK